MLCKHELEEAQCSLCRKRREDWVLSAFESFCRKCRQTIEEGERITRVWTNDLTRTYWAHFVCPSYVRTRGEERRYDPVATTPVDRSSRYHITQLAQEEQSDDA